MLKIIKSKAFKVAGLVMALAFMVTAVSTASAMTTMTTTTTVNASAYNYSGVMKSGSKGPGVATLQAALNSVNSTTIIVDSSFGPATKSAVMQFQAAHGLTADGVVGPMTGAALSAATVAVITVPSTGALCPNGMTLASNCMSGAMTPPTGALCPNGMTLASNCMTGAMTPPTPVAGCTAGAMFNSMTGAACATTPVVTGGAGNLSSVTLNGSPSNTQVGEGAIGTGVLGFQLRADAGSNLNIQNVRVNLVLTGGSGSTWPSRYISGLSVWQGTNKVGSVSVAGLSQNGTSYNVTIPLSGATVAANTTSNFTVSVDANSSIDSNDANDTFAVYVDSIRYGDASGAVLTTGALGTSTTGLVQPMRFLKLSSSASVKLTLSEDLSNPKDRTVTANYTSTTNDVSLLRFNLSAAGSNMIITKIALPATATGVTNASSISAYYKLKYNGSVISSFTLSTAGLTPVITFGDTTVTGSTALNGGVGQIVIPAGSVGNFEVVADVKALATGTGDTVNFDSGDTLKIDYTSTALSSTGPGATTVQDQTGASLGTTSTNRTGSATGYNATFRVQGVNATYVGNTFTPTKNTSGVLTSEAYTTTVQVTATGNDFFVNPIANHVTGSGTTTRIQRRSS
jgi:hypothetical protein